MTGKEQNGTTTFRAYHVVEEESGTVTGSLVTRSLDDLLPNLDRASQWLFDEHGPPGLQQLRYD